ncbi:MAG: hypothetical protein HQL63_00270 [Magnetococcales bacterium]|nr:hypothetical protein [Magnetococcales bacterium]MBF0321428.1 hypothetical protein [Magnetococcales bacterium]
MILVSHRINTRKQLLDAPQEFGVEVDLRSRGSELILHHDPFVSGERFETWLDDYNHRLLILNVKEEGLEQALLEIMAQRGIHDFFFLDQSFPFLLKTARSGETRCAVRVSEFETVATALALGGMVDWVWVDCFTRFPLTEHDVRQLGEARFKLCLVSPELQGRFDPEEIRSLRATLQSMHLSPAAVCTKFPQRWI